MNYGVPDTALEAHLHHVGMNDTGLQELLGEVKTAAEKCRGAFEGEAAIDVVLERMWGLQDWLGRLVDAASDEPAHAGQVLRSLQPELLSEIGEVLSESGYSPTVRTAGVSRSRRAIQELLTAMSADERMVLKAAAANGG